MGSITPGIRTLNLRLRSKEVWERRDRLRVVPDLKDHAPRLANRHGGRAKFLGIYRGGAGNRCDETNVACRRPRAGR